MKIILSGGGTLGSVSPLIAVLEKVQQEDQAIQALWLATKHGAEIPLIKTHGIPYQEISSGKFRRYYSLKNFTDIARIVVGFFQSIKIILRFKPEYVLSAGGFVAVPVVWAAWLLRVKVLIHQQDIVPGLANKLCAPCATHITVTFSESLKHFTKSKTIVTGNPVREQLLTGDRIIAQRLFNLEQGKKTILVLGGGTGAKDINDVIVNLVETINYSYQIIHISGGKISTVPEQVGYHHQTFLTSEMKEAYAAADIVVTRAGLGTLTELTALRKPTIIIPIPQSHQEYNAAFYHQHQAAVVVDQKTITAQILHTHITQLLSDQQKQQTLIKNMSNIMPLNAAAKIASIVYDRE